MKKIHFPLSILLILGALLSGCQSGSAAAGAIGLTDGLGRKVELSTPAQKIISMAPSQINTRTLPVPLSVSNTCPRRPT